MTLVLGIETSCDETAVAIVASDKTILAHEVYSQDHRRYGGVVPELAARAHSLRLEGMVWRAMESAALGWSDLEGIAATVGPGLIGGLIVGSTVGKAIAVASGKRFLAINHLQAHALTVRLTENLEFPYLLLLVSGGHCQLVVVRGVGRYQVLGTTLDDAVGEAFDKVSQVLGLGYPGGPEIERTALRSRFPGRFRLPCPMLGRDSFDFSFSGLKTAVSRLVASSSYGGSDEEVADLACEFQRSVIRSLSDRCQKALEYCRRAEPEIAALVVAGGVGRNQGLRSRLSDLTAEYEFRFFSPPLELCGDNAAIVAWAGLERLSEDPGAWDPLSTPPKPRWSLDLL